MKVAVVDSGIDTGHERLKGADCTYVRVTSPGSVTVVEEEDDNIGHGTACASIIRAHVPDLSFAAVKIFHKELATTSEHLCAALQWCMDNNADVVNLSLGLATEQVSEDLHELCREARDRNKVIVAASNNDMNIETYPAFLPSVLGVCAGYVSKKTAHGFIPDSPVEYIARGTLQRIAWKSGEYRITSGSSFACAHFTGIVCKMISKFGITDIADLEERLLEEAESSAKPLHRFRRQTQLPLPQVALRSTEEIAAELFVEKTWKAKLGRIGLFPISEKEARTVVSLREYCTQPIAEYIDFPFKVGSSGNGHPDVLSKSRISSVDFDAFDTLTTGYFRTNVFEGNIRFGEELVEEAMRLNKNLFLVDETLRQDVSKQSEDGEYTGEVFFPNVGAEDAERMSVFRHLPRVRVPVVAVVGTGSRQGKFTAQVVIKDALRKAKCNVEHLSTEPYGVLYGASYSFPYGFMSTVSIPREIWGGVLCGVCKGLQYFRKADIILTGTQGLTVPRGFSADSFRGNETSTIEFLCSVMPDAIVCTVYGNDEFDIIHDVCDAVRIVCGAKTIMLAMMPINREVTSGINRGAHSRDSPLSNQEKIERMSALKREFGIPVVDVMDASVNRTVVEAICGFFS